VTELGCITGVLMHYYSRDVQPESASATGVEMYNRSYDV
jgi:hypothetical protein